MKYIHLLTLLFCISYGAAAPYSNNEEVNIIGGHLAREGQYPYQVSIRSKDLPREHFCGGAIIDETHVLTAAHCFAYVKSTKRIYIGAGVTNMSDTKHMVKKEIDSFKIHEKFSNITIENDICIIKIKGSFVFNNLVKPVELNQEYIKEHTKCLVSGWGWWNLTVQESPDPLKGAVVPIANGEQCVDAFKNLNPVHLDSMVCAGDMKGGTGVCRTDSGGPLVCNNKLTGIVSFGKPCAKPGFPDVYARVEHYIKWINDSKKEFSYNYNEIL